MTMLEIMQGDQGYVSDNRDMPGDLSARAKTLCWQYNQTAPNQEEERACILQLYVYLFCWAPATR